MCLCANNSVYSKFRAIDKDGCVGLCKQLQSFMSGTLSSANTATHVFEMLGHKSYLANISVVVQEGMLPLRDIWYSKYILS